MEFVIKTDLNSIPKAIDFNFDEMKSELTEKLEKYNALVVTEDSIKSAKDDRAKLNKLRTAIEDRRKEVKKLCLAPYDSFEKQCKEITALIDEPIKSIDGQISVFDQKLQDEKWNSISDYYASVVGDLAELVPLEKIVSPKWKNKTESLESINNGIGDTLDRIRTELELLDSSCPDEFVVQVKEAYLQNYSINEARAKFKALEETKLKLEAAAKAREEASKVKPEVVETPPVAETPAPVEPEITEALLPEQEPLYSATFKVVGTKSQIIALKEHMKDAKIKYEVIK